MFLFDSIFFYQQDPILFDSKIWLRCQVSSFGFVLGKKLESRTIIYIVTQIVKYIV